MLAGPVLQFIDFLTEVRFLFLGYGTHLLHQTANNTVLVQNGLLVLVDTLGILNLFQLFPDVGFDLFDFSFNSFKSAILLLISVCYSAHCALLHTCFTCAWVCIAFSYCNYSEPPSQIASAMLTWRTGLPVLCSLRLLRHWL